MAVLGNYTTSKFRLYGVVWLQVGAVRQPYLLDVVNAQLTWALNDIPSAYVTLAIGREAQSGLPANIHYLVNYLQLQLPFQLYLTAFEAASSYGIGVENWPRGPFLLFEGYLTGSGYRRTGQGAGLTLAAQHWLVDLNFSSALSRLTNALNPSQLSAAATFLPGTGLQPSFTAHTLALDFFTAKNVTTDFWGQALLPWLNRVCAQDLLVDPDDPVLNNPAGRTNFEATRALKRFEPLPVLGPGGQPLLGLNKQPRTTYRYGVPLQLNQAAAASTSAVSAIADGITSETFESMSDTTLWGKLGEYAGSYSLALVPMVQTALVVPFCPGLRSVWQTIYAEEYDSISFESEIHRALRGVRLFGGLGSQTGAFGLQQGEAADQPLIGGRYDNPNLKDGQIYYLAGPRWLANVAAPAAFGQQAANPGGPVGNAFFPGAGPVPAGARPGVLKAQGQSTFNLFAQAFYVNAVIKDRRGVLQGKLRFDIAPGSSVQIMVSEERFVERLLGPFAGANSFFGTLTMLTHVLDAEAMTAGTQLFFNWLRSPLENTLEGTSLAAHPLWQSPAGLGPWTGAPNVDLPNFIPRGNILNFGR